MLTTRELNRSTLARQLLLGREALDAAETVRRVVALQAQHAASPYLALWNRITAFDPADLDAAFADRKIVKATLLRITLHAVHADDHPHIHEAMQPSLRGPRLGDPRFTRSGLTPADADALVGDLLAFADQPRSAEEIQSWIEERLGVPPKGVWWALRSYAPLLHAVTGAPWSFGARPAYIAAGIPPTLGAEADPALQRLILRYLEGFGPATAADVAQFALVTRKRARGAIDALAGTLQRLTGPDGSELFDLPGAPRPAGDTPAPVRLLPMWDNVLLAHADRSRVIPPQYRKLVTRTNGDVLPTLLVDGYVAGVWRPTGDGIEATAFHPLPGQVWDELAGEAQALAALLADREPGVYRRYDRWWSDLPGAELRIVR
ncbi:winged helix DNA-binding domain-containing protein [Streptosporangium sp. NBC_01639]|uniref:winged helix DNA-binding domain-containing protein n=1 Tax=Streptosporangium sp. NBC_01639 TaxID=2975948 RepID=UPI00386E87E0|nr:winged helix DNA-binding domain-containing protein [Streptosporangium sp. NBC_01639]